MRGMLRRGGEQQGRGQKQLASTCLVMLRFRNAEPGCSTTELKHLNGKGLFNRGLGV